MKPLLSIIIPTRNRYSYLEFCLKSILPSYNNEQVEIIITDNSSPKVDISGVLSLFRNIKYAYIDHPISQVENFELALSMTTGDYLTMIGDDDSLSDRLISVVKYMEFNGIEALNAPFVTYFWPDVIAKNKINNFSGKIFFGDYTFKITSIYTQTEIEKCLILAATSLCNLPRMYYGIIKRTVLAKVKDNAGVYFPGPSPDMANAFSAAIYTDKQVYFDAPLFIAGNSAKSAAGMGLSGKHVGAIEGNKQLPKDCHLKWNNLVPKYWSGSTIWAESALQAIYQTKNTTLLAKFNYCRLYASCISFDPEFKLEIKIAIAAYKKNHFNNFKTTLLIQKELIYVWLLRFKFLARNLRKRLIKVKDRTESNILNVEQAYLMLKKYNNKIDQALLDENK